MKADGHILMPVYHVSDTECKNVLHYDSRLTAVVGMRKYEASFETEVKVFNDLKGESKDSYIKWLESYLKRSVAKLMLDEGVVFTYK